MADALIGEIRLLAGSVVPADWLPCDGSVRSAFDHESLFGVIGTTFGGSAADLTFALPDLRGRVPVHVSTERALGVAGGQERVTLSSDEMPPHTHTLRASGADGDRAQPGGNVWARSEALGFSADPADAGMHAQALSASPAAAAHENTMPFLGLQAIIAAGGRTPDPLEPPPTPSFFKAELRMMAFNFAPAGWDLADGQVIEDPGDSLSALLGTIYGGNGSSMLALPDLGGRVPIHRSDARPIGRAAGEARHTLTLEELPAHSHAAQASGAPGDHPSPEGRSWGLQSAALSYAAAPDVALRAEAVGSVGGGQPHDNMPPFLTLTFCLGRGGLEPSTDTTDPASDPFVGEIRLFAFDFVPLDWARCDGQVVPIAQHAALFDVIRNTYGGDGVTTFALPDLRGRAPVSAGQGPNLTARALGEKGGADAVTLDASHLPAHTHEVRARAMSGGQASPEGNVFGEAQARALSAGYASGAPAVAMSPAAVSSAGGGQPHENMPPYLPLNFCISLTGIVPQ